MANANPRINVTVPVDVVAMLNSRARKQHIPVSRVASDLIVKAMEYDEDVYFSRIAEETEATNKRWISHEDAWD
ncbi:hypothetical protein RsTz2092_02270 [Deferribacterales bacterium RsTz2092]|nr:hypothetical protein AGMMS49941_01400 [Deferribacterales bacterium]